MTVSHNHFYWGHGMSIGSETNGGVSALRVIDLSLDGPDSGIRIKSMGTRGGLVHDAVYDDICIRDSPRPIDITMAYAANGPVKGPSPPTFRDITLRNVRVSGGGKILFDGYDHDHRAQITLDGVYLTDPPNHGRHIPTPSTTRTSPTAQAAATSNCPRVPTSRSRANPPRANRHPAPTNSFRFLTKWSAAPNAPGGGGVV